MTTPGSKRALLMSSDAPPNDYDRAPSYEGIGVWPTTGRCRRPGGQSSI